MSHYYSSNASELNKLITYISNKDWTVSGCFSSRCRPTKVLHAIFPEINPFSTEATDYPTEKRQWIQKSDAWVGRIQKVWRPEWVGYNVPRNSRSASSRKIIFTRRAGVQHRNFSDVLSRISKTEVLQESKASFRAKVNLNKEQCF
jgi:hypothetical protein